MKAIKTAQGWAWLFSPEEEAAAKRMAKVFSLPEAEFFRQHAEAACIGQEIGDDSGFTINHCQYPTMAAAAKAAVGVCAHYKWPWATLRYVNDGQDGWQADFYPNGEETEWSKAGEVDRPFPVVHQVII